MTHALRRFLLFGVLLVAAAARALPAQSVTTGGLSGIVRDTLGEPLASARVEVIDQATGFRRDVNTTRAGEFGFRFLPPGRYDVVAEVLGYRPTEVRGVRVIAGPVIEIEIRLTPAEPPVLQREIVQAGAGGIDEGSAFGWTLDRLELQGLPDERRDAVGLGRYTSLGDASGAFEGLPASLSIITVGALPVSAPRHPTLESGALDGLTFPLMAVERASLEPGGVDVEWSGYAGSRLTLSPLRGGRRFAARAFGDWSGSPVTRSEYFAPEDLGLHSFRGGLVLGGPVIRDTAAFALGVEVERLETPVPPSWVATPGDNAVVAVAADSFGVGLAPRLRGRGAPLTAVSGFGRFEWQADARNLLSVFATGVTYDAEGPPLGAARLDGPDGALEGADLGVIATLTSALSRRVGLELRAGFETGRREYSTSAMAGTRLTDGPIAFGTDPMLPGRFERTAFRAYESLHLTAGRHRLKLGGGASFFSHDLTYAYGRPGEFVFGGVNQFAEPTGGFSQRVGRTPTARFKTYEFGGWLQDRWQAAPGLDLILGMRLDWEHIPIDDIADNAAWFAATGVSSDSARATTLEFSPRLGLVWDFAGDRRWVLRLDGGLYHGDVNPAVMAEALTHVGPIEARRAVGILDRWPLPPDSVRVPIRGPVLAPLALEPRSPRTTRAEALLSGSLGGGAVLHLGGVYRHTDFLIRRRDLNLAIGPSGRDQYGRPVYGALVQTGSALLVEPGTNRRFTEFDEVLAIDFDGFSDYVALTGRLEQRAGRSLTFSAGYTYSHTTDNWIGVRDGRPDAMLSPFPDSLDGVDWAEGRSDFDIPHRVVFGAELAFRAVRVAAFFRHQSGYPFTPGFRDGVDANGDGSFSNDPATVDEVVAGVADLFGGWDCLRRQLGRTFVERNACRGPAEQNLDLRFVAGPFNIGYPVALVVDAVNLLENSGTEVDRALYLVDPAAATTVDPQTGAVNVPLVVNPGFGQPVVRRGAGRFLRLGLRINY